MKTYTSGSKAPAGIYLAPRDLDLRILTENEQELAGKAGAEYKQVPLYLIVLFAPLIGAIFALGFPAVIFAAFAHVLFKSVRTYRAGEAVGWGVYFGFNRPAISYVSEEGERLAGKAGTKYLRLPSLLLVLASPVAGGFFVLAFPVILAAATVTALVSGVRHGLRRARADAAGRVPAKAGNSGGSGRALGARSPS